MKVTFRSLARSRILYTCRIPQRLGIFVATVISVISDIPEYTHPGVSSQRGYLTTGCSCPMTSNAHTALAHCRPTLFLLEGPVLSRSSYMSAPPYQCERLRKVMALCKIVFCTCRQGGPPVGCTSQISRNVANSQCSKTQWYNMPFLAPLNVENKNVEKVKLSAVSCITDPASNITELPARMQLILCFAAVTSKRVGIRKWVYQGTNNNTCINAATKDNLIELLALRSICLLILPMLAAGGVAGVHRSIKATTLQQHSPLK